MEVYAAGKNGSGHKSAGERRREIVLWAGGGGHERGERAGKEREKKKREGEGGEGGEREADRQT